MRLTEKNEFFEYALPEKNRMGDKIASEVSICQDEWTADQFIVGEAINHFGELEDVLEKWHIENLEGYISALIEARNIAIEEKRTQFKRYIEEVTKREKLEQELAELKGE